MGEFMDSKQRSLAKRDVGHECEWKRSQISLPTSDLLCYDVIMLDRYTIKMRLYCCWKEIILVSLR
jgi:hypothetical protein